MVFQHETTEQFCEAVDHNWPGIEYGIAIDSGTEEEPNEGSFSGAPCDCCGSGLGGDRYKATAFEFKHEQATYDLEICVDCVQYIANGETPDHLPSKED